MSETTTKKRIKYRMRKLIPEECFQLQGLTAEDCKKARAVGISDCQLFRQAGNGLVTNCIALLIQHLYKAQYDSSYVCKDERLSRI